MLYIIATSIGNIEDTTLRSVKTLSNCDIILCEDTRSFGIYYKRIQELFNFFPQKDQRFISFHKENEFERISEVIDELKKGKDIALVSESGTPLISDPGSNLIKQLLKTNMPFTAVPGPTAFVNAALLSGFPTDKILFLGFLPKKPNDLLRCIDTSIQLASKFDKLIIVFYESPYRINKTLEILYEKFPNVKATICREMTKKFEEVIRGKPQDLKDKKYKGEITVSLYIDPPRG